MRTRVRPGHVMWRILVIIAGIAGIWTVTAPAQAAPAPQPSTATARCAAGTTPDTSTTLHLSGGRPVDYSLRNGDVIQILPHLTDSVSVTGGWWQPADGSNWVTPAGLSPRTPADSS